MPFAIWCTNCKPRETLIGQGVRFNAEKKRIGNYFSTPIYSFRMKHTVCGGWIEIQTDPKNTAYVVTEGARKRDTGEDKLGTLDLQPGEIRIKLLGERGTGEATDDPFARLEWKVEDKRQAETVSGRLLELQKRQDRDWDDPYEKSRRLRATFRKQRKLLENAEANREALKDKMSLGIELVDESEEDRLRASMVDFGPTSSAAQTTRLRPMFDLGTAASSSASDTKHSACRKGKRLELADISARKEALREQFQGNKRAAIDPFLASDGDIWHPEIKRRNISQISKQGLTEEDGNRESVHTPTKPGSGTPTPRLPTADGTGKLERISASLVNYCSDSE